MKRKGDFLMSRLHERLDKDTMCSVTAMENTTAQMKPGDFRNIGHFYLPWALSSYIADAGGILNMMPKCAALY